VNVEGRLPLAKYAGISWSVVISSNVIVAVPTVYRIVESSEARSEKVMVKVEGRVLIVK
jgi:hypothetical protein